MNVIKLWLVMSLTTIGLTIFPMESAAAAQPMNVYKGVYAISSKKINIVNIKETLFKDRFHFHKVNKLTIIDKVRNKVIFLPLPSKKISVHAKYDKDVFIHRIANAIHSQETGGAGSYQRQSYSSSACGAYQYIKRTWNNWGGYSTACAAPSYVQDERIIHELEYNFERYDGDWKKVIASHLYPARANDPSTWNKPIPGNPTVNEYVSSVLAKAKLY